MDGLKYTMAAIPGGNTRRTYGTAFWDGTAWFAEVGGNVLTCRWLDPIQPLQGGKIVVDITTDEWGQSTALVIGGYTDQPRPSTGTIETVIPAGISTRLVFQGADGVEYTTDRFIGDYSPGDPVYVTWDAATPTIIGKITALVPTPAAPTPSTPSGPARGETTSVATASDTFGVGGWGRWATSQKGGEDIYSGTWGGYTLTGSWFYGAPKPEMAGKTVDRIQFKVPARLAVGASGPATIHLYAHTAGSRPGADVARVVGPFDIVIPDGWAGGLQDLPLTFAPIINAGGGISIAGDPYVGLASRLKDPESGKIIQDWTA